jgi:hypothetical protein
VTTASTLADLDEARQRLTRLLAAEYPDFAAIIEAADVVRRLERQAAEAERVRA